MKKVMRRVEMLEKIDSDVLIILFFALIALIVVCIGIGIAYFVLRKAVQWGVDNSKTGKIYRALEEEKIKKRYDVEK